jgi:hypothetical protein
LATTSDEATFKSAKCPTISTAFSEAISAAKENAYITTNNTTKEKTKSTTIKKSKDESYHSAAMYSKFSTNLCTLFTS